MSITAGMHASVKCGGVMDEMTAMMEMMNMTVVKWPAKQIQHIKPINTISNLGGGGGINGHSLS